MKKRWRTAAAVLALIGLVIFLGGSLAEGAEQTLFPPSPEPPPANREDRPTPAPTEEPESPVIDHIHYPRVYPDFTFPRGRKLFEIWFPNIRDADEALLMYDGDVWMIDCGDERMAARGVLLLRQLGIEKIGVLFNSHPHHDHIDGLALTDDTAKIGEVRICFSPDLTASGLKMIQTAEERHIPVTEYRDGDTFSMGDGGVVLQILKNNEENLDMNNQSAITRITYGDRSILFMADMEKAGQETMINRVGAEILECDIVKYPHHAKSDMYTPFFQAMKAKLAVATSVEGRGDPGQISLINRRLPVAYTAVKGKFIHLVTDGKYWLCEYVTITEK